MYLVYGMGVFVQGGDDDDTAGLMHDEFLLYYIYYNGWSKRDIVPLKDINEDAWDYDVAKNIPVEYDNYSYYDNAHTLFGIEPLYRTIECYSVNNSEFSV